MKKAVIIPSIILVGMLGLSSPAIAADDETLDSTVDVSVTSEAEASEVEATPYVEGEIEPRDGEETPEVTATEEGEPVVTSEEELATTTGVSPEVEPVSGLTPEGLILPVALLLGMGVGGTALYMRRKKIALAKSASTDINQ